MDKPEAAKILLSWRPGVDDNVHPFAEALAFAQSDPELRRWVEEERIRHGAIRGKLGEIEVPAGLAGAILAQRPIPFRPASTFRQLLQLAAALIVLLGLAFHWFAPGPRNDIAHYEAYLTKLVAQGYHMSLQSNDAARIRSFLAGNQAPSDYSLSKPVSLTTPLGCATLSWNGNPVTMLCFRDKPDRNLWLFVVDRQAIPNRAPNPEPRIDQFGDYSAATWESGGRTYVLTVKGGPDIVRSYL